MTKPSFFYETSHKGLVIGVDEVGVGCWAGPVFAGAAFVPLSCPPSILTLIHDSKKLSPSQREKAVTLFPEGGIYTATGKADLDEIEQLNIKGASFQAMRRAVGALEKALGRSMDMILLDGVSKPDLGWPVCAIASGDQKSYSIAAASIAAKVAKDAHMKILALSYPEYGWETNQGYGTPKHQEALKIHGVTPHHRKTYAPIKELLQGSGAN